MLAEVAAAAFAVTAVGWALSTGQRRRLRCALADARHRLGHDALTGLRNRDGFRQVAPAAGSLLLLDLDKV